jgi:hypothetical protein
VRGGATGYVAPARDAPCAPHPPSLPGQLRYRLRTAGQLVRPLLPHPHTQTHTLAPPAHLPPPPKPYLQQGCALRPEPPRQHLLPGAAQRPQHLPLWHRHQRRGRQGRRHHTAALRQRRPGGGGQRLQLAGLGGCQAWRSRPAQRKGGGGWSSGHVRLHGSSRPAQGNGGRGGKVGAVDMAAMSTLPCFTAYPALQGGGTPHLNSSGDVLECLSLAAG